MPPGVIRSVAACICDSLQVWRGVCVCELHRPRLRSDGRVSVRHALLTCVRGTLHSPQGSVRIPQLNPHTVPPARVLTRADANHHRRVTHEYIRDQLPGTAAAHAQETLRFGCHVVLLCPPIHRSAVTSGLAVSTHLRAGTSGIAAYQLACGQNCVRHWYH